MKNIVLLLLVFFIKIPAQEKQIKLTEVDILLESLSFFSDTPQKVIDSLNSTENLRIDYNTKFKKIDSLMNKGIIPFYNKDLIPSFKENYVEYRNGNVDKALVGFQMLMKKGFGAATFIYANSFRDINQRNKYLKLGISQCSLVCQFPLLKEINENEKVGKDIELPKKCYK